MEPTTDNPRAIIGVYEDEATAQQAVRALTQSGVSPTNIRAASTRDTRIETRAEMQGELSDTRFTPPTLVTERNSSWGIAFAVPICAAIGGLIALPFALIEFGSFSAAARTLLVVAIGLSFGAVVGLVLGASAGALQKASRPLATEHGVTIRVDALSPNIIDAMHIPGLLRLDEIDPARGTAIVNLVDEEKLSKPVKEMKSIPRGEWSAQDVGRQS